jgi:hypothetical protein
MHKNLRLLSLSALALGAQIGLAHAQTTGDDSATRPGHVPGDGVSLPISQNDSNVMPGDTHSDIAPTPPPPGAGPDAGVGQLLMSAKQSIAANQTGTADAAMEQAETLILTRAVPQSQTDYSATDPVVGQIEQARTALGKHDNAGASQILDQVLGSNAPELAD